MIVTLTPNPAVDYTLQVGSFALGETIRASAYAWGMGGKGTDAAWILGKLGIPTAALGFTAGENGKKMEAMLRDHEVDVDFIKVEEGDTRLNIVIVIPGQGQSTFTSPGFTVQPVQFDELLRKFERSLENAECAVIGGSLPAGAPADFYPHAIQAANKRNVPVIFDASGPALAWGLEACPSVVKPNRAELEEMVGSRIDSTEKASEAAGILHKKFGSNIIVTLGEAGAVAVLEGRQYFIPPLEVAVMSTAGAGDGILAGMALSYYLGEPLIQGVRRGFALAGAIVQTLSTAGYDILEYQRLLPEVQIHAI